MSKQDQLNTFRGMVRGYLVKQKGLPSISDLKNTVSNLRSLPMFNEITADMGEQVIRESEEKFGVSMTIGNVLIGEDYAPWFDAKKINIDFYYWDRYRELLQLNKGVSKDVINAVDSATDRIIDFLEDPEKQGTWDRRGLVVGHIQSGKTSNYIAMICKAADAGYKLIVVIAGIHNKLRNQTQQRVDEGFIGRDSAQLLSTNAVKKIGVGKFDNRRTPSTFTTSLRDFNRNQASSLGVPLKNLNEPVILVIKKNANTLKNLLEWLKQRNAHNQPSSIEEPMLLIDDEADNASINIKGPDTVSRINEQIRQLLKMFDRSCYVGYTATPFANIFIDPATNDEMLGQDLFPKDFIVSLDPPTNYFGANKVFHQDDSRIIQLVTDNEDHLPIKHPIEWRIESLPESLKEAVRTFIIARAIRILRGQGNEHCSMFVNATRFTNIQSQLRNEIHDFIQEIGWDIKVNGSLPKHEALDKPNIKSLYNTWQSVYSNHIEENWDQIQPQLLLSTSPIKVIEVNSKSSEPLDYTAHEEQGLNVIAVGGNSLSRGLTLEGLMVSYFLRNSRMYDTLMQMGRWFGYRQGYEDLCRIWMTEESEDWYYHISDSIEELREELRTMAAASATPKEFGLKVRSHPAALIVTARNKFGTAEKLRVAVGLSNHFVETSRLKSDKESLESNRKTAIRFVESLRKENLAPENAEIISMGRLLRNVPAKFIISFIRDFVHHPISYLTNPGPVCDYIEERLGDNLEHWDVLFTGISSGGPKNLVDNSLGFEINCQRRKAGPHEDENTLVISNKQRVSSRGVEKAGLSKQEIHEAEENYNGKINFPDRIYRAVRKFPLFIIHMLAIGEKDEDLSRKKPVVAWSISFPRSNIKETTVEYLVNTVWIKEKSLFELGEDEHGNDED